ncbi:MAG: flavodoxin family protein [Dysgonomonas sp.]
MKIAIRYFSKTGHIEKMASVVSDVTGVKAETINVPITEEVDILFLGSAVYMAGIDDKVKDFVNTLDSKVKKVICFSSAAILPSSYAQIKALLEKQNITVDEKEFHCRGQFTLLHRGRPNQQDLEELRKFIQRII